MCSSDLYGCGSLTGIDLPSSLTAIPYQAFCGCAKLRTVTIGSRTNQPASIGEYAFQGCVLLESVDIPGSVSAIGGRAFQNCKGLRELTLHEGLLRIQTAAFEYCSVLEAVDMPSTVISVEDLCF